MKPQAAVEEKEKVKTKPQIINQPQKKSDK